jgi:CDP-diacylglycerol--glycerol-3-phosphate 3-phosphatidyltransferase
MAECGKRANVKVSNIGKWKTMMQMFAITCLLLSMPTGFFYIFLPLGYVLLYIAAGLTVWSLAQYSMAAWPELKRGTGF